MENNTENPKASKFLTSDELFKRTDPELYKFLQSQKPAEKPEARANA